MWYGNEAYSFKHEIAYSKHLSQSKVTFTQFVLDFKRFSNFDVR